MTARILVVSTGFLLGMAWCCGAAYSADSSAKKDGLEPLPAIMKLEPLKEERPDVDPKHMVELYRIRRARYNAALQDLQMRTKLQLNGRLSDQSTVFEALKRLQYAEYYLPGRPTTGKELLAAERSWLEKKVEFLRWYEGIVQRRHEADVVPLHELLEAQFHRLDAEEKLVGDQVIERQGK